MGLPKFSFTNLVASATLTPSTEDSNFLATNAKKPERPWLPWKTMAVTQQSLIVDFGSDRSGEHLVLLSRTNFTSASLQWDSAVGFPAPNPDLAITIARNPVMWRYQHAALMSPSNKRYFRLLINAQTPVDGANAFLLGGLWIGVTATPPRAWSWDFQVTPQTPSLIVRTEDGRARGRVKLDDAIAEIRTVRRAAVDRLAPFSGDQADSWLDLDRQMWDADYFALFLNFVDAAAQAYIVRVADEAPWRAQGPGRAESSITLEEVVA